MSGAPKIAVRGVGKVFPTRKGEVRALEGADLEIAENEFVSIVGTALSRPGTSPPSTLTKAASIPATAMTTRCAWISGTRSRSRQMPATPTSMISSATTP